MRASWARATCPSILDRGPARRIRAAFAPTRRPSRSTWSCAASGTLSAAGDTEQLEPGDLALIPPATDHSIANEGDEPLACVSVQSPAVSVDELFDRQLAGNTAAGYDDDEDVLSAP